MTKDLIWIVDDDRSIRWVLEKSFDKAGFDSESFDLIVSDFVFEHVIADDVEDRVR